MSRSQFLARAQMVAVLSATTLTNAAAQSVNFVTPTQGDSRFGFDRSEPGTTYAEWFRFERTGGGGSPGNIPDDSPQAFSGFAEGGASVDGNTTSVTGGGTIINGTEFSVGVLGFHVGLGNQAIVALQVEFSSNIDDSIFSPEERDEFGLPLPVIPAADPALDTATPQFDPSSPLLSTELLTGVTPTDVIELARFYDLAGRGGVVPTLFTSSLMLFELPENAAQYSVDFAVESGTGVRSVAIDTFIRVPEPTSGVIALFVFASLAVFRRR